MTTIDISQDNVDCKAKFDTYDFSINLYVGKSLRIKMTMEQWQAFRELPEQRSCDGRKKKN